MSSVPPIGPGFTIAGRFRIISQLGEGGMGVVYRAWDTVGDVPVVLKMPKENLVGNKDFLVRFSREIRAMATLVHPHIVPIVAHGETADGRPYVVMRFLPGGSLSDRRQPLKNVPSKLHLWLPAVASALDYVHANGVVHRDVKPDNVFFDAFWSAYVGDFGIAKVVGESAWLQKDQTLTGTTMMVGTQAYMAPELFSPKAKIDGRVDQYALGIMVYEMLSAVRPFTGEKSHLMFEHLTLLPPPLSSRCDGLPNSLCAAVHRSLSKQPEERFNSCGEFAAAVLSDVPRQDLESGVVRLLCPSCSTILKLPLTTGGRQGKCPKCQTAMNVAKDLGSLWLKNESLGRGVEIKPISTLTPISTVLGVGIVAAVLCVLLLFYVVISSGVSKQQEAAAIARQQEVEEHETVVAENIRLKAEKAAADQAAAEKAAAEKAAAEKAAAEKAAELAEQEAAADKMAADKAAADQATAEKAAAASEFRNTLGMEFVKISKGDFQMGSPAREAGRGSDETPVAVSFSEDFELGKTEVTQGQWQAVMGTEPWKGQQFVQIGEDIAASYVNWNDATAFCQKLTGLERKAGKLKAGEAYRLPTEAQWEYACRAGTTTAYSFGDDEKQLGQYAWFDGNASNAGEKYAHKVGMKQSNPWGLHDMHGNVWEWCSDWYGTLTGGADPVGPGGGSNRVLRGGSWGSNPVRCWSADRSYFVPSYRIRDLGFRVARSQLETVAERRQGAQAEPAPQVAAAERPVQLEFNSNSIGMKLVVLPAGKFTMGEGGGVAVTLTKPFLMGTTEVTQGQFKKVMGTEPWKGQNGVQIGEDIAASYVDWNDVTAFCQKLTKREQNSTSRYKLKAGEAYRLPTEAEWEYACRAGTTTAFSFGDNESTLGQYAWFNFSTAGEQYAHKVGMKQSNPWGLHDMHGNVQEWCSDWYAKLLPGGADPVGPGGGSYRVIRGGSWWLGPGYCRSAFRNSYLSPSVRDNGLGFRVARSQSAQ